MNISKYKYLLVSSFLLSVIGLGSCSNPDTATYIKGSDRVLKVRLNLPAMQEPSAKSRAMSYEDENTLVDELLNVMVVKNGVVSKATITGPVVYDVNDHSKATITVKLPESEDDNDKIRLCVIANFEIVEGDDDFDNFKQVQQLAVPEIWPTTLPIPMWGESDEIVINENSAEHTIDMYRAVARIDVGLGFVESGDGKLSETANGVDGFKMGSVFVYNTKMLMNIVPATIPPVTPNAPADYTRSEPLIYDLPVSADSYVREIYVPEAGLPDPFAAEEMHCVIVGGFWDGSATETFYRLEFAAKDDNAQITYLPLLRNHRYVFNIVEVRGRGYASPEEAFSQPGAVSNMKYDLVVLDESIHRMEFKDGFYFGLDDRNLTLEPQQGNSQTIKYQTNLPDSQALSFEWADPATGSARYSVVKDAGTKSFTVETLTENVTGNFYTDILYVKSGPFSIPVNVNQKSVNLNYSILSESVSVSGVYILGEPLDASHYITLTIQAEDISINGKPYVIETVDPAGNHGISFSASGVFDFNNVAPGAPLETTVVLQGSGTLAMEGGAAPFKLRIITNSILGDYMEVTIVPVNPIMNIVVISSTSSPYGYSIARLNGGAGKVFNSTNNFGPYDNSIVKSAGFNYISSTNNSPNSEMLKWITGEGNNGKIADMIYIAYNGDIDDNEAKLLAEYLKKGGVIIAFLQDNSSSGFLMKYVFPNSSITRVDARYAAIIPMPANPKLFADTESEEYKDAMRKYEGDPILNGPFGDIRDKQIGEDAGGADALSNFPTGAEYAETITIYAYDNNLNGSPIVTNSTNVYSFKLEEDGENGRNLFYCGDGGLMSSPNGVPHIVSTEHYLCPFWWDTTTFFPIPRPLYGYHLTNRMDAYNSTMFCNVMAWGIKRSNALKARRLEYEQPTP